MGPSGWCSPCHQEPWWPECHWTQTPGHCHAHYQWAAPLSSWQSCWVLAGAPQSQSWLLKNNPWGQKRLDWALKLIKEDLWFQQQGFPVESPLNKLQFCQYCGYCWLAVTYRKACAGTSQSRYHGRIPFQYGWSPVQCWLGWRWLAHHRSPSACWGRGPDCLCQVRIQSSYWSLRERRQERGKNEKTSFSTVPITAEQSVQGLSIVITH